VSGSPGIVSAVSTFLAHNGQNILTPSSSTTSRPTSLHARGVHRRRSRGRTDALQTGFTAIADRFAMDWQMRDRASRRRVMLLVSKSDHCLVDISTAGVR